MTRKITVFQSLPGGGEVSYELTVNTDNVETHALFSNYPEKWDDLAEAVRETLVLTLSWAE